ncbi:substrate-binding domain-containing protein [Cellulomonas sp. zg-ZUI22]|uniref:substrate-binding domain-containing protein n=1 Tax=Cellulomonas sp. zg-ZUI22 TaxID=2816955 RepID=UPI001A949C3F|nr:substrate-binding domain-containing protein [Cellulomonas sp. zg-ZUI22]MBO0899118.1 substrate-binding domain-containing protein [Cellulomonas sp. zg-ZUI22]
MNSPRPRMGKPHVSQITLILAPATIVLVLLTAIWVAGIDFDHALGIAGLVYGVAAQALAELRQRDAPRKSIVVVGMDDHPYLRNIVDGLRDGLDGAMPFELTTFTPPANEHASDRWQVHVLDGIKVHDAHAVVVLPSADNVDVWNSLARLQRKGIFVIVADHRPPRELFVNAGLKPPPYVASDFLKGGSLAGRLIADRLQSNETTFAVVAMGPGEVGPGTARSGRVVYELARSGLNGRTRAVELASWDAVAARDCLFQSASDVLTDAANKVIIFCGDDRILLEMQRAFADQGDCEGRVELVGYDGTYAIDGQLLARDYSLAVATIDTQPRRQGDVIAQILRDAYHRQASQDTEERLVEPQLVETARP